MKIIVFSAHNFEKEYLLHYANEHIITFISGPLNSDTVTLAKGHDVVSVFTNDKVNKDVIDQLSDFGIKLIALRCAGFNNVDLSHAKSKGIPVTRVPEYSPQAIAEHTMAMILTLNRKTHKAYNRVRENNFNLDGLVGFDLYQKTVGVIGTGKIGKAFCKIALGFGCKVLAFDLSKDSELEEMGVRYVEFDELLASSKIISLHIPLNNNTYHLINDSSISKMQNGVVFINTSRGGLVNTKDLIKALKDKKILAAGLDVYEEEENLFFDDHSLDVLQDDDLARLMTFPNTLITSHQAFLTHEALNNIAQTTFDSINSIESKNFKYLI
ncbi:2-hydroxyacid dehydrogenase [Halobacteriovorax sp.]|uniref:2-hydroxyacid dehydrogenase n=1 Tax=Halobacteriovorax sp. TaxID=2020862 RepID=UPI003AF2BA0C